MRRLPVHSLTPGTEGFRLVSRSGKAVWEDPAGGELDMIYRGPWVAGTYDAGSVVTTATGTYVALAVTSEDPTVGVAWDLIGATALDGLTDVNAATATSGQTLVFDAASSTWSAVTPVGGGGSGFGVPPGGATGTVLKKISGADGDVGWGTDATGGGGGGGDVLYPPGSSDAPPEIPDPMDDEFDGSSLVAWAPTPTPAAVASINGDRVGHLRLRASGSGNVLVGIHQPAVTSYPRTYTTKLVSSTGRNNYHRAGGFILLPSDPTNDKACVYAGVVFNNGIETTRIRYANLSTFGDQSTWPTKGAVPIAAYYLRAVVHSATNVSFYTSVDGFAWLPMHESYTLPFALGRIGVGCSEELAAVGVDAYFGFFRVA